MRYDDWKLCPFEDSPLYSPDAEEMPLDCPLCCGLGYVVYGHECDVCNGDCRVDSSDYPVMAAAVDKLEWELEKELERNGGVLPEVRISFL
jgi:hypothetical protein